MENVQAPITHLERARVVAVVDEGLGHFLQHFVTEASLDENGEFVGFRIVRVDNRKLFAGLGIGPGDVIVQINDKSIERPAEAFAAFVGLKKAERLDIDYLRGGRPMRLSLPIVGKVSPESLKKPSSEAVDSSSSEVAPEKAATVKTGGKKPMAKP